MEKSEKKHKKDENEGTGVMNERDGERKSTNSKLFLRYCVCVCVCVREIR